jgi:cytochrome P450
MNSAMRECPVVDFDMLDPDFARDPYETMAQWRALGPVVYNSHHDQYLITTHQGCTQVLSDNRYFQLRKRASGDGESIRWTDFSRH